MCTYRSNPTYFPNFLYNFLPYSNEYYNRTCALDRGYPGTGRKAGEKKERRVKKEGAGEKLQKLRELDISIFTYIN